MTKPVMDLKEFVEKSGDADLLREMIGFAAERLTELEVGGQTGAGYGRKSSERLAQRTGTGRPGSGTWSCAFRSCARAATSPPF